MVSASTSSSLSLHYVMTKQQPQTRVFDPTGNETFVTRQSDIGSQFYPSEQFPDRIIANNWDRCQLNNYAIRNCHNNPLDFNLAHHINCKLPSYFHTVSPPTTPHTICDDDQFMLLHAGNYRLKSSGFWRQKRLLLSKFSNWIQFDNSFFSWIDANYILRLDEPSSKEVRYTSLHFQYLATA